MEVAAAGCYGNTGHRYWQLDRQHQMEWGVAGRERGGSHAVERRVLQLKARTRIQIQAKGRGGSRNVRRGEKDKKEN